MAGRRRRLLEMFSKNTQKSVDNPISIFADTISNVASVYVRLNKGEDKY